MIKHIIQIILISLLAPLVAKSQLPNSANDFFTSTEQKFVRAAVDSSLLIIRQDYDLKDKKGNEFGRAGKNYFGRNYYLGVKSYNKVWLTSNIESPWTNDKYYSPYQKNDSIKPQLIECFSRNTFSAKYSEAKIKTFSKVDSSVSTISFEDTLNNISCLFNTNDSEGWLVIISTKEDLSINENADLIYTIYKASPQFSNDTLKGLIKKMPVSTNILGGIYFTNKITTGNISFFAAGILARNQNNWCIAPLPTSETSLKQEELTPINKKDEKKSAKQQ